MAAAANVFLRRSLNNLPRASIEHIIGCARCTASLVVLVRSLDDSLIDPGPCTCAACEQSLPAFVDLEASDAALAATSYPSVWWHLWHCASCAELYGSVNLLMREMPADLPAEIPSFQIKR
jgi:hypothetical protein